MELQVDATSDLVTGDFSHSYGSVEALVGVQFSASKGETVGIVGPSGCGKSTLLSIVAGTLEPTSGHASVAGSTEAGRRSATCAFMPQRDLLLPWLSALDNAALAPRLAGAGKGRSREEAASRFERFGLAGFEESLPTELSGGMRQRVALLRTLTADRQVLCLDEPFSALDALTRADLQQWLARILAVEAKTCLLVTHDVEESLYLCDRVIVLSGRPGSPTGEVISPNPRRPDRATAVGEPDFVAARQDVLRLLGDGRPER